jgi:CubicO group peptidase (beta-lactamase class C family)
MKNNHANPTKLGRHLPKALMFCGLILGASISHAALVEVKKNLGWVFKKDLSSAQFSQNFDTYNDQDFIMTDFDAYPVGNETRYSMLWKKNLDKRGWAMRRDMSEETYASTWLEYKNKGMRLVDVEAYELNGSVRWGGIWIENKENLLWASHRNQTGAQYATQFAENNAAGYRVVDLEVYNTPQGLRYASIWVKNTDNIQWTQLRDMSRTAYQAEATEKNAAGYKMVDLESYDTPNGQRYAAIWEKHANIAWRVRSDLTEEAFTNVWNQYTDEGLRLVDFERYETDQGARIGTIWAENESRYQYSKKTQIDNLITNYASINNLPGISVVIIQNGSPLYQRGFGFADIENNRQASSKTVYSTASLAKVIGGTLAAKLENEKKLRDGSTFALDLSRKTDYYIRNLPAQHTHTVEQLLSHLACIPHYSTTPAIANQTTHYTNATTAMQSIWANPLVQNCVPNANWSYSTHAFTYVGAVLESVTKRSISNLLNNELFDPYDLTSMRAMYENNTLPANSLRAAPYTTKEAVSSPGTNDFINPPNALNNPNILASYTDSSWKVLGGGIETNTMDLSRFGWKVLNGEILSPAARDNRLWTRVNPGFTHGLGWSVSTLAGGLRIAEWNGGWTGARTYLRVYRDNGLVIGIMSNRRTHRSDIGQDVNNLTAALGTLILN